MAAPATSRLITPSSTSSSPRVPSGSSPTRVPSGLSRSPNRFCPISPDRLGAGEGLKSFTFRPIDLQPHSFRPDSLAPLVPFVLSQPIDPGLQVRYNLGFARNGVSATAGLCRADCVERVGIIAEPYGGMVDLNPKQRPQGRVPGDLQPLSADLAEEACRVLPVLLNDALARLRPSDDVRACIERVFHSFEQLHTSRAGDAVVIGFAHCGDKLITFNQGGGVLFRASSQTGEMRVTRLTEVVLPDTHQSSSPVKVASVARGAFMSEIDFSGNWRSVCEGPIRGHPVTTFHDGSISYAARGFGYKGRISVEPVIATIEGWRYGDILVICSQSIVETHSIRGVETALSLLLQHQHRFDYDKATPLFTSWGQCGAENPSCGVLMYRP